MLVLTRNEGQSIVIQTDEGEIEITICGVHGKGRVKIGIQAPDSIDIWRSEVLDKAAS